MKESDLAAEVFLWVITRDENLSMRIRQIVGPWGWDMRVTGDLKTFEFPTDAEPRILMMAVLDREAVEGEWKEALAQLRMHAGDPCVLLASPVADDYLWREVVRCGGYDVIGKSAVTESLTRTLHFAWFWKRSTLRMRPRNGAQLAARHRI